MIRVEGVAPQHLVLQDSVRTKGGAGQTSQLAQRTMCYGVQKIFESDADEHEKLTQEDLFEDKRCHGHIGLTTSDFPNAISNVVQENALEEATPILGKAIMRTKTTFLEFKFIAYEDSPPVRRNSTPPCFGCSGDDDMWRAEASAIESGEQLLWTTEDVVCQPNFDENQLALADILSEKSWNSGVERDVSPVCVKRKSPSKAKRDKTRHCKGKRMRLKKFMLHLCEEINEDPQAFDIALIRWPPSLIDNSECREYLRDILEAHRARALQGCATKADMCNEVSLQLESALRISTSHY